MARHNPPRLACRHAALPSRAVQRSPGWGARHHARASLCRCVAADVPIPGDVLCGEGGGGGNPLRGACASLAQLYFEGVDRLAGDAFQIDQEEQKQHVAQCQAGAR